MVLTSTIYGRDLDEGGWPSVAVIMPVRNEEAHLAAAVESILAQAYPGAFSVCLAVGPSDDATAQIAERLAEAHQRVTLVDNPTGRTPAGLNAAIEATDSDVIVRVDGHSHLSDGYITAAVSTMARTGAVNVGGVQHAVGTTRFERAVAESMGSRIGTGGARFHVGGEAGPVDTVYLGVFDRAAGDRVGWFDERLIRNQDYELNIRLRAAGGTIWFTPELSVDYQPRSSWTKLARQYYEYGYWKAHVLRLHPASLRIRQAIPAALPFVLVGDALVGGRMRCGLPRGTLIAGYLAALVAFAPGRRVLVAAVAAVQQVSWGVGFAAGTAAGAIGRFGPKHAPTRRSTPNSNPRRTPTTHPHD